MGQSADQSMSTKAHWEAVFRKKQGDQVSWYQPHLRLSMRLFARAGASAKSRVIDIGGGDSTLVDDLLAKGVQDVTVLDISSEALSRARKRLGASAGIGVSVGRADTCPTQAASVRAINETSMGNVFMRTPNQVFFWFQ